ncbi:MAG: hypothetical protein ACYDC8_17365 [Gammaproteobacteria bacterium]
MSISISASKYEALVSAGNYLFLDGYDCQIGEHFVHNVDETPSVRRQIERFNTLLKLLMEQWRVLPYVVSVDGKPAVFVTREVDTLFETLPFPHERFFALVALAEHVAQDVSNPEGSEDKYRAQDKSGKSKAELVAVAKVPEALIREILPAIALHPGEGVEVLVRNSAGDEKVLRLPPTEAVRKPVGEENEPVAEPVRKKGLAGVVVGEVPVYGYLVLDDGTFLKLMDCGAESFIAGKTYVFHEVAPRSTFTKQVRCVTCEGGQGDLLP